MIPRIYWPGLLVLMLALLASLILWTDRAEAQSGPEEDTPPLVFNAAVNPTSLGHEGGTVTVSADVTDDVGVARVYADVVSQDGNNTSFFVELQPAGGTLYSATVDIPQNFTDNPIDWAAAVTAEDTTAQVGQSAAGEVTVDAQPQFDEPPVVSNTSVDPRNLPAAGGPVTIEADASDLRGISEAYAVVTLSGGGSTTVPMEGISSSRFRGVFNAPANTGPTPQQYSVEVSALDDIGQQTTADAGPFTVAGTAAPSVRLRVSPQSWAFGRVLVGKRERHAITLRNPGGRSTPPITGVVSSSGAPFRLVGGGPGGTRFSLRGGQSRTYAVEFRPTATGLRTGAVSIRRTDGRQPGLGVRLSGRGVARR